MSKFKVGDKVERIIEDCYPLAVGDVGTVEWATCDDINLVGYKGTFDPEFFRKVDSEDLINSPTHYAFFPDLEAIQVIARSMTQEQFYGYCLGNRLKYRLRAGNKDALEQDIAKSDKYIELYEKHKHLCHS